ncbi:LysR family transcriptional regulator [Paractinoplanes deccanensis]|uniref:LysR family transcriptional regulator n=1 Tax=Paractinoplanes deccanensis TaxID=113561 RepID=A0ABQ3YAX4_9ACTN|nr:NAD(P)H-binding protein [Actinoplanes deccanensis]GID77150.1 LysR family transcriptional regulator [Actinoplanes deccanensis]
MKIAVIGGTGLIGSQVVKLLNAQGHEAAPYSLSNGVDLSSGKGVAEAIKGAQTVINLTNSPTFDDASAVFFRETMENLIDEAEDAGTEHIVILSIVGADRVPDLAYYRAKVLQETLLAEQEKIPYSIVRATQFFEFVTAVMSWTSDDTAVRLPSTLVQPMASAEVANAVAQVAAGEPLMGVRDYAGPEVFPLDELGRITLAFQGDRRPVVVDESAGLFAAVHGDAIIARDGAVITRTTYQEWVSSR